MLVGENTLRGGTNMRSRQVIAATLAGLGLIGSVLAPVLVIMPPHRLDVAAGALSITPLSLVALQLVGRPRIWVSRLLLALAYAALMVASMAAAILPTVEYGGEGMIALFVMAIVPFEILFLLGAWIGVAATWYRSQVADNQGCYMAIASLLPPYVNWLVLTSMSSFVAFAIVSQFTQAQANEGAWQ